MPTAVEIIFPGRPLGDQNAIDTIVELRALDSTDVNDNTNVLVANTGFYKFDPSSLAADNGTTVIKPDDLTSLQAGRWLLILAPSAALSSFIQAGTGATARSTQDKLRETVSIKDFGAVCDGVTDDRAAVQAAVDYCLSLTSPPNIINPGRCRLASSVMVDRLVDTAIGELRFVGGTYYVTTAITMFDSTISVTTDPKSEYVTFEGVQFESSSAALAAYVMSKKFLRICFSGCFFQKIKCLTSNIYAQEIRFRGCTAINWAGTFFQSEGAFRVISQASKYQFGGAVFDLYDNTAVVGISGCSFVQDEYEGNTGAFLTAGNLNGGGVYGLYSEGNTAKTLLLAAGGSNVGFSIIGCYFAPTTGNRADTTWYDIECGNSATAGLTGIGNRSMGRLYDDNSIPAGELVSIGDFTTLGLNRSGRFIRGLADGMVAAQKNVTAFAGGGAGSALQITAPFVQVLVSATAGDSLKLPPAVPGAYAQGITVMNGGAQSIDVFRSGTDTILGGAGAYAIASARVAVFYCTNAGNWLTYAFV